MADFLQFEGVSKSFPGVRALSDVSFGVGEGSVHALMGENGAGKSTLLKILSGVYRADAGTLSLDGKPQSFRNTLDALRAGVAVIYQELQLVPQLSVAENLFLGHLPNCGGWVDRKTLRRRAAEQLQMLGEDIDPRVKLGSLPIGQRQMVEIAKALARDAKVIAFDEPTSSLSARETDRLFAVIRNLRQQGKVILYVSHRMDEIYAICDAATVLRDGQHVETYPQLADVTRDELVRRMVGRSITDVYNYTPRELGAPLLEVKDIAGPGLATPASFTVHEGEILGFFGLIGAGRSELMRLVYGATRAASGSIALRSKPLRIHKPPDAIKNGIVLLPEDRKKDGIIPVRSVQENTNVSARRHFSPLRFLISYPRERANAARYVQALSVKTPKLGQEIRLLSGGNQQKVIIGRWLGEDPKVVLFDEPTRGIDVGAKSEIYRIIYGLAERGVAVVVVSSELPEVMGVSDRIIVMRQGHIAGEVDRKDFAQERLLAMALPHADERNRCKDGIMTTMQPPQAARPLGYAAPPPARPGSAVLRSLWENAGMLLVFVLMFACCAVFVNNFFSWVNLKGLLLSITAIGMISCTMLFCLAAGDFDLSVGSVLAMGGMIAVVVSNATGSAILGILAGVASGAAIGLLNGFVIAQLGINALITTLATMQIARGLAFKFAPGGASVGIKSKEFQLLGQWADPVLGVRSPIWLMILCAIVFGILLRYTTFGRNTLAIGGNAEAARLAGIRVTRTKLVIFTLQGALAAFAGIVMAARLTSGQPNNGLGLELHVISACVLGGVSLTGGVGTIIGVIVGVLIMGTVNNVMALMGIAPYNQYIVSGVILLAAVIADRARTRGSV